MPNPLVPAGLQIPALTSAGGLTRYGSIQGGSLTHIPYEIEPIASADAPLLDTLDLIERLWGVGETSSVAYLPQQISFFRGTGKDQTWRSVVPHAKSLEERLFEALAAVKVLTSKIAMHLDREWRDRLFAHLDRMHSPGEWQEDDELLSSASFETFLKAWFLLRPQRNPGFGISVRGYLFASWVNENRQLTLEFFPDGRVSWVLSIPGEPVRERASGQTAVVKLMSRLAPYEPELWFANGQSSKHR